MASLIIAVDGPVAAGKGTLGRRIAAALDFAYMDTGSIYRAVAARLLEEGGDPEDRERAEQVASALDLSDLERDDLRRENVGQAASKVAGYPGVRAALLAFQRRFAEQPPDGLAGAVLDGRDIGTVVCPDARVKLFITATPEARAKRRHRELIERGEESIYARVLQDLKDRDTRDSGREAAPLKVAEDAAVIDTTDMDIDHAFETAMAIISREIERSRP